MPNKKIFIIIGVGMAVVVAGLCWYYFVQEKNIFPKKNISDPKNMTYVIGNETFDLKNGKAEKEYVPGSATKNSLVLFGEPTYGDLNKDGKEDAAILLANDAGGTGVFYFAVLAIKNETGYTATNAMFLGDRIAPQNVEIRDNKAVYNFAERKSGEPMTAIPSMGRSVFAFYDAKTNEIGEWIKDFEGEAADILTEKEARTIAERLCIKEGETLETGMHNKDTQTWWFDVNLKETKEGCNPACVLNEPTKTVEINWRCTGLLLSN